MIVYTAATFGEMGREEELALDLWVKVKLEGGDSVLGSICVH